MPQSPPSSWPADLAALGWFRFVDAATAEAAKRAIVEQPYALAGDVGRMFHTDAEDLAEGGILNFLGSVVPVLRAEGVAVEATFGRWKRPAGAPEPQPGEVPGPLESLRVSFERGGPMVEVTGDFDESAYVLHVGEHEIVAWSAGDDAARSWEGATVATLDVLNLLLETHGSIERAWAVMGGNDLHVVFASDEARRFINATLDPHDQLHDGSRQ